MKSCIDFFSISLGLSPQSFESRVRAGVGVLGVVGPGMGPMPTPKVCHITYMVDFLMGMLTNSLLGLFDTWRRF